MPIFEKDGQRIMFAHIPKSGGVSIYSSFVGSGWQIKNLRVNAVNPSPGGAFSLLQERFGIETVEQYGKMFRYPHSPQHAPQIIWRTWGPFDASFTVVREPMARLLSALRYHHRAAKQAISFADFSEDTLQKVMRRPWSHLRMLDGHLIPQHYFIGRETQVFRFEEDWGAHIAERFGVTTPSEDNKSPSSADVLSSGWEKVARRLYKKDYARLGY